MAPGKEGTSRTHKGAELSEEEENGGVGGPPGLNPIPNPTPNSNPRLTGLKPLCLLLPVDGPRLLLLAPPPGLLLDGGRWSVVGGQ